MRRLFYFTAIAILILAGCQSQPTASAPLTTSNEVRAIDSGGIGLSMREWEQKFGPLKDSGPGSGFSDVGIDRSAFVAFTSGRVRSIQLHLHVGRVSEDEARNAAMTLLPRDTMHFYRSTECRACRFWVTTDRLVSASLGAFQSLCTGNILWKDAQPGEIHISIRSSTSNKNSPPDLVDINWACDAR